MGLNNLNFNLDTVADVAAGSCVIRNATDDWMVQQTRLWCHHYTTGQWSYRIDDDAGIMTFSFELQQDADDFRAASAADPDMVTCQ